MGKNTPLWSTSPDGVDVGEETSQPHLLSPNSEEVVNLLKIQHTSGDRNCSLLLVPDGGGGLQ